MAGMPAAARYRYVTLAEARGDYECNLCGECCSSVRAGTSQYWWGDLPKHNYRGLNGGRGLITLLDESLQPRRWKRADAKRDADTPFACSALRERDDGTAICALFKEGNPRSRPARCSDFPVGPGLDEAAAEREPVALRTDWHKPCTWYRMIVVPDGHPLLRHRDAERRLRWSSMSAAQRELASAVRRRALAVSRGDW